MSKIKESPSIDEMIRDTGGEPIEGHDQWVREKIRAALKAKHEGRATYKPLREVAGKYDFDAR